MAIAIKRRSWLGRVRRAPGHFLAIYRILRAHNGVVESAMVAWGLTIYLVRTRPTTGPARTIHGRPHDARMAWDHE